MATLGIPRSNFEVSVLPSLPILLLLLIGLLMSALVMVGRECVFPFPLPWRGHVNGAVRTHKLALYHILTVEFFQNLPDYPKVAFDWMVD